MLKLRILLCFVLFISGCVVTPGLAPLGESSGSNAGTSGKAGSLVHQPGGAALDSAGTGGLERVYGYPYKKVFYAADLAVNGIGEFEQYYTKETNFEKGFISLNGGVPAVRIIVNVEKVDDNKTVVRIEKHTKSADEYLDNNFFQNLDHLLNNK